MTDRRPYTAKIGMDALVERADGSTINFGDAIYHPENEEEAREYALAASEPPSNPERLTTQVLCSEGGVHNLICDCLDALHDAILAARLTDTAPETAQQIFDQHGEPTDD